MKTLKKSTAMKQLLSAVALLVVVSFNNEVKAQWHTNSSAVKTEVSPVTWGLMGAAGGLALAAAITIPLTVKKHRNKQAQAAMTNELPVAAVFDNRYRYRMNASAPKVTLFQRGAGLGLSLSF